MKRKACQNCLREEDRACPWPHLQSNRLGGNSLQCREKALRDTLWEELWRPCKKCGGCYLEANDGVGRFYHWNDGDGGLPQSLNLSFKSNFGKFHDRTTWNHGRIMLSQTKDYEDYQDFGDLEDVLMLRAAQRQDGCIWGSWLLDDWITYSFIYLTVKSSEEEI